VTLRARLALAFALFAAVPLGLASWPVSRALSRALEEEHAARLAAAARAVEGEILRLGEQAAAAIADLARSPEAESLARDHASGEAVPRDEAERAAEWGAARGLELLAVADAEGRVVAAAHLPGRAGDVDPELADLLASAPPARAVPRVLSRASPEGLVPVVALVAWAEIAEGRGASPLRVAGGRAIGAELAARLAALTGGAIVVRSRDGPELARAEAPGPRAEGSPGRLSALLGQVGGAPWTIPLGPPGAPVASIELSLASEGLARARAIVLLAFAGALAAGALAAAIVGRLLAARVTRPVDALRAAAARVAAGDLEGRVGVRAAGEIGELVEAFDAMTADLARSRARLAHAERIAAWREVARRLAHEIKNPLTPIAMSVETLRDARARGRGDFEEIFEEGTRAIGEEVRRLKRIVDEFSRFARLPAPERAAVAPSDLVSAVVALFPAPPTGVRIERAIEPGAPPVLADRDQIVQVLLNLVRNALDAMPGGGTLAIGVWRQGDAVRFTISDTGPGIAPADLARVFEPYFTTKEGGTGLGLAIAHRIAEEHEGTLEVASPSGGGATFALTLPVAPGRRAQDGSARSGGPT
jgi:two-component system, NtrC family, nitrogen regulation sensor histidine kinase NtrY